MKSDITEILLPPGSKVYKTESVTYTFIKALVLCALVFGISLSFYRYETKFQELEYRITDLESQIDDLHHENTPVTPEVSVKDEHRNKRQAPQYQEPQYSWVVRSASGDPMLNPNQRGDDDSLSTEEGIISGRKQQRRRGHGRQSRRRTDDRIIRNHADETFYTTDVRGQRFLPSGLKEMRDRLPPVSTEYVDTRHAPDVRTRSLPPVRRVGQGRDQVSARVVKFEEEKKPESVVAHFVADVSNFTAEDNPRLRNTDGVFQIWRSESWNTKDAVTYNRNEGAVTVHKTGIYYVYAQIHYHDANVEGFVMEVNDKPLLQCTSRQEFNSCFTAGLTQLKENDRIVIKNIGENIFSIFKPEKSFFGMMKVAE